MEKLFFNFSFAKKSQAEAFGLVLIVALVFVIFAIMARIEQGRAPSDLKSNFETTEISSSTMNTMLTTVTRGCNQKTFSEIAADCIRNPNSFCQNNVNTCEYFLTESAELLNEVFQRARLDYYMEFSADGRILPEVLNTKIPQDSSCSDNLRGEEFPIPLNPGTLVLRLVVCRY